MPVKAEYVLLGLGAVGLAYWYFFFVRPAPPPPPPLPPEGYELAVKVVEA